MPLLGGGIFRLSEGDGGALASTSHPAYDSVFNGEALHIAGDNDPLSWSVTRADGVTPATPTSATVHVWGKDGALVATLTPDLDPAPAAGSIVLAALWPIGAAGTYLARLTMVVPGDGQIRSEQVELLVLE